MRATISIAVLIAAAATARSADTLVLCPPALQPALADWIEFRREQGHAITLAQPGRTFDENRKLARAAYERGGLRHLLLVGDTTVLPCGHEPLQVISRWGPDKTAATDHGYADLAGDAAPEIAVGRIPFSSPAQLRRYLRRVIDYERGSATIPTNARLSVVASPGNFSPLLDRVLEASATRVLEEATPPGVDLNVTYASPASRWYPGRDRLHNAVADSLVSGSLAWVYLGHGLPDRLDAAPSKSGARPLLDTQTLPRTTTRHPTPVACMLACYTGSFDRRDPCLAEAMLTMPSGPLTVVAASTVSMPYGNSRLGLALLRTLFRVEEPSAENRATAGEMLRSSKHAAMDAGSPGDLGRVLDQVAQAFGPTGDQARERVEHLYAYNLLGDPLVAIRPPMRLAVEVQRDSGGKAALVCHTPIAGKLFWRIVGQNHELAGAGGGWESAGSVSAGRHPLELALPPAITSQSEDPRIVHVRVDSSEGLAVGIATLIPGERLGNVAAKPAATPQVVQ
ncbi:MAG: C25 family cysteine peptidase [Planctomycetota bacterium]